MTRQAQAEASLTSLNEGLATRVACESETWSFDEFYEEHFAFVWRTLRRLGVPEAHLHDAAQEVFLVVHRKQGALQLDRSLRSWLYCVVRGVAKDCRRALRRKDPRVRGGADVPEVEGLLDAEGPDPHESLERADAVRTLHLLLDELEWSKREVFVLVELEQLSVPEAAEAIGENLNTTYSRLRAARVAFNQATARHLARERRRTP